MKKITCYVWNIKYNDKTTAWSIGQNYFDYLDYSQNASENSDYKLSLNDFLQSDTSSREIINIEVNDVFNEEDIYDTIKEQLQEKSLREVSSFNLIIQ